MGADESSSAAAASCGPCTEVGLLCSLVSQSEVVVLVTRFPSLGRKNLLTPVYLII